ncbi:MAG TPA: DUF1080 domain-containing protein [Opitutaceae bacterium]|nr:DUF1080 domain-containing protein [Opitutaceae bacterium]
MLPRLRPALAALLLPAALFGSDATAPRQTVTLFNGRDLAGWTAYRRPADASAPPTWSVADGVIQCTGAPAGYIRTDGRYRDYRLTVEWRWVPGEMPLNAQGRPRGRNSGVLLHMAPPEEIWPKSLEAQLAADNAGDFWVIGGVDTAQHIAAREKAVAAAGADEEALKRARGNRRFQKSQPSSEKPIGEWNTYEIVCSGDTVTVTVNGVRQNQATGVTVREGHICLQSEGAPIEFRKVKLEPLR